MPTNDAIGKEAEIRFADDLKSNKNILNIIKCQFNINGDCNDVYVVGTEGRKRDVIASFTDKKLINFTIKAFNSKSAGYNHVGYMSIQSFCDKIFESDQIEMARITKQITDISGKIKGAKAFIQKDADATSKYCKQLIKLAFIKDDTYSPDILATIQHDTGIVKLYLLKNVLYDLNGDVSVSDRGVLQLGSTTFVLQRRGGSVGVCKYPATDPRNPKNGLQFKLKMKKFEEKLSNRLLATYIIE